MTDLVHFREVSFSCDFFRVRTMSLHVMEEQSPSSSLCLRFPPVRTARSKYDVCAVGLHRRKRPTRPHLVVDSFHPLGLEIARQPPTTKVQHRKCYFATETMRKQTTRKTSSNSTTAGMPKQTMTALKVSSSSGHCKYYLQAEDKYILCDTK